MKLFAKIWYRRGELSFPIHAYLIRAIQNGCLNYLRSLHSRERIIDEYREALLEYQEEFCASECSPLQEMELADLEKSVQNYSVIPCLINAGSFLSNIFIPI